MKHINYIYRQRIWFTMIEQLLMRYVWGACGMVMIAIPAFARFYDLSDGQAIGGGAHDDRRLKQIKACS